MVTEYEKWEQKQRIKEFVKELVLTFGTVAALIGSAVVWLFV